MCKNYSWTCPYCQQIATITDNNLSEGIHRFDENNRHDVPLYLQISVTVCPNRQCREFTINAALFDTEQVRSGDDWFFDSVPLLTWQLRPQSAAKPFPSYIPAPILQDYSEACLIRDLSPKASATLARRCLQGMIRDFWGISKSRLVDEINDLQGKVDSTTWQAINAVRSIGNIGAHMEKDINVILDVEPEEAALLVGLIEVLLEEWYIRRHDRNDHMRKIIDAAQNKSSAKSDSVT